MSKTRPARTIGIALAGAAANWLLGSLSLTLGLPLYFDSIFTISVTAALGPAAGILTAVTYSLAISTRSLTYLPFVLCTVATVLSTWLVLRGRDQVMFKDWIWVGIWAGLTNAVLGSVISAFVFGGVTGAHRIDNLVSGFIMAGQSLMSSVFIAGTVTNLVDKLLSALIAFGLHPLVAGLARGRGAEDRL